jgi:hypothetical protein
MENTMNRILAISTAAIFGASVMALPVAAQTPGATTPGGDRTTITGPDATGATGFNVHGFWTDDTRTQLLDEPAFRTQFEALTIDEQAQLRAECDRHEAGVAAASPEWLALCERITTM